MSGDERKDNTVVIISRQSKLALVQTEWVRDELKKRWPEIEFVIETTTTQGDKILDVALNKIGDKGLFTKELEVALLNGSAHIAVHSLKDMPTRLPEGLTIGAITKRHDSHDAVVASPLFKDFTLATLPENSIVGTSSLRRIAQLKRRFPHLKFESVRGNLATRLRKLDEPGDKEPRYSFIILAQAGLERQGLGERVHEVIDTEISFPAVGQGALAIECREGDERIKEIIQSINDQRTAFCCEAERSMLRSLEGGCQVPVAVYSQIHKSAEAQGRDELVLSGRVLSLDGQQLIEAKKSVLLPASLSASSEEDGVLSFGREQEGEAVVLARALGCDVAQELLDNGAKAILDEVYQHNAASQVQ